MSDVIHGGHINHLTQQKNLRFSNCFSHECKFVNKGFDRPIFNLNNGCKLFLNWYGDFKDSDSIDAISIIEKIKPNIYCKGPDYKNFDKDN